ELDPVLVRVRVEAPAEAVPDPIPGGAAGRHLLGRGDGHAGRRVFPAEQPALEPRIPTILPFQVDEVAARDTFFGLVRRPRSGPDAGLLPEGAHFLSRHEQIAGPGGQLLRAIIEPVEQPGVRRSVVPFPGVPESPPPANPHQHRVGSAPFMDKPEGFTGYKEGA